MERSHSTSSGRLLEGKKKTVNPKSGHAHAWRSDRLREVLILEFHLENFGVSDRRFVMTGDPFRDVVAHEGSSV